jgi:hypothetical protein
MRPRLVAPEDPTGACPRAREIERESHRLRKDRQPENKGAETVGGDLLWLPPGHALDHVLVPVDPR